jgi:hypothetical protein
MQPGFHGPNLRFDDARNLLMRQFLILRQHQDLTLEQRKRRDGRLDLFRDLSRYQMVKSVFFDGNITLEIHILAPRIAKMLARQVAHRPI